MIESIGKLYLFKYWYFFKSNVKRLILINLISLIPIVSVVYGLVNIIPYLLDYFSSMNMAVLEIDPDYNDLVFVVMDKTATEHTGDSVADVFIFKKSSFKKIRRFIFLSTYGSDVKNLLMKEAIGGISIPFYGESITIKNRNGKPVATVWIDKLHRGAIEVFSYRKRREWNQKDFVYYTFFLLSGLILLGGVVGGIGEYVQRMVYHEVQKFTFLFNAIARNFFKSIVVFLFLFIITAAVAANIYFYIFIVSSEVSVFVAALNIWMLIFFLFILQWVYPLMVINSDESIWRTMKKSLFFSFDNFEFSLKILINFIAMFIASVFTAGLVPGVSGILSFLSNSLKEISVKYRIHDTT